MRTVGLALTLALALGACSGTDDTAEPTPDPTVATTTTPTPTPTPTPTRPASAEPEVSEIGDAQWQKILDTGSWREGCPVGRDDLRVLSVNFVNFSGEVERGRIVANRDTVTSLGRLFDQLYAMDFPIQRMQPVEEFGGDTLKSLQANNTSAYNCRRPDQINAPVLKSPHANGRAIDINPDINPWQDIRCKCWSPRDTYAARTEGPGKILKDGPVVKAFEAEGWIWQNISVADYMHFDTGYPSAPLPGA